MKEIMFILGRNRDISLLEIISYLNTREINFEIIKKYSEAVIVSVEDFELDKAVKELGGTVKIGEVLNSLDDLEIYDKAKIAFSFYEKGKDFEIDIKNLFKKKKLKYVVKKPKKGDVLSPSEVIKKDLVENGFEFLVFEDKMAITRAVYNPFLYKQRDVQRPGYDERKIISIRLAKMLINLGGNSGETLFDPFCGYGTILQEAMVMGFDVLGLDNDKKSVEGCRKNLEWVKKEYGLESKFKVFLGDACRLGNYFESVDVVVTEPYLGPFLKSKPSREEAIKIKEELERLYSGFFKQIKKIVKGKVVIVFPRFLVGKEEIKIDSCVFRNSGFEMVIPGKEVPLPLKYDLEEGKLQREIYILH